MDNPYHRSIVKAYIPLFLIVFSFIFMMPVTASYDPAQSHKPLDDFQGNPPIHVKGNATGSPVGLSPQQIKAVYQLPSDGGNGTIAVIDAYDYPTAEKDLNVFSAQFGLPECTQNNGCFEKYPMAKKIQTNSGWALEAALDTQWVHAIAPKAKILLVEAKSATGTDLLAAVDYARKRSDVVAISMSWGGGEFVTESDYNDYFISAYGASFFASSGDNGTGVQWPAVSPNVIGVGGTSLLLNGTTFTGETAWSGSGGGLSKYEPQPAYQTMAVPIPNGMRAVPDVSYNADPNSGIPVYNSTKYHGQSGWFQVGGTSAGAPQWAAIRALNSANITNNMFYTDALVPSSSYFRDITSGTNGDCGFYCSAGKGYDYVTGLGSPITTSF